MVRHDKRVSTKRFEHGEHAVGSSSVEDVTAQMSLANLEPCSLGNNAASVLHLLLVTQPSQPFDSLDRYLET